MTTALEPQTAVSVGQDRNGYSSLSLVELVTRIADCEDRDALRELHNERVLFRIADSQPMRLATFVDALGNRRARAGHNQALLEQLLAEHLAHTRGGGS